MWDWYVFYCPCDLTIGTLLTLVLTRWFLGLTDMRWRAAELSSLGVKFTGLLMSTPAVGVVEAGGGLKTG